MLRRYLSLPPWKRRLLALVAGIAIGAAVTAAVVMPERAALRRFREDYIAAQHTHDVAKLATLFCWDGVPATERGRLKLALKQESDADVVTVRLGKLNPGDGAPRDSNEGRRIPNLAPVCRLTVEYGVDVSDTRSFPMISTWLVGKSKDGYRIVVYRPEKP